MHLATINELSKTTPARRDELYRWLNAQGEPTRFEVIRRQTDLARRHRNLYSKEIATEFYYAMHVLAVLQLQWEERALGNKARLTDTAAAALSKRRLEEVKGMRKHRPSPKQDVIRVRFFEKISVLRKEGVSWQKIAYYLEKHHKAVFAATYLRRVFTKLEQERAAAEGRL